MDALYEREVQSNVERTIVFVGVALVEGLMSGGEIGTLVFIISAFLAFAFGLAWASRHGG